ncbi:MAG: S8 family serine peptidase [Sedimentisphaerales bacterium]|nr:S8 family serine peptidase [Sedimentisphaerales bacterium]
MRIRTRISAVVVGILVSVAAPANGRYLSDIGLEEPNEPNYVEGELLVRFAPKHDETIPTVLERRAVLNALDGAQEIGSYWLVPGLTVVKLPAGVTVEQALGRFNARGEILYAEPNWILRALVTPNDPYFADQWGLNNTGQTGGTSGADVNTPHAWDMAMGTQEIVVAVIDTGVDYNHPDLAANMWVNDDGHFGKHFWTDANKARHDSNDPMDDNGHGTHCAGIIGAVTNNGIGVAGVCPNVRIMALKFLASNGYGETVDAISCIQYAINNGANIMSNSWGGGPDSPSLKAAIEAAGDAGLLFVAAAGNKARNNDVSPYYPASYDCSNIIAVAATDHNDALSSFSHYGATTVDLGAPGSSILSTYSKIPYDLGKYEYLSGTSMACPHVSGACALVWSINPDLDCGDLKSIIMDSVDEIDSLDGKCVSEGRLNVHRAILKIPEYGRFVTLDRQYYSCSGEINIIAGDSELAGDGTTDVNLVTSAGNDLETVTLTETPADSGLFLGSIATSPNSVSLESNYVEVSDGETVTVTFSDANDTATVDCVYPVISNIDFNEAPIGPDITIAFDTNELTVACVRYGTTCGGPYTTDYSKGFSHNIKLLKPSPLTKHYFIVEATDLAGNTTADTNDANCYTFTTDGPIEINVPGDFNSIQDAIDQPIWDGSCVIVSPGTYNEIIDFKAKAITVRSTNPDDWDIVKDTIVDSNGADRAFLFNKGEDANSMIRGLTIKGLGLDFGIVTVVYSQPTISRCIIEGVYGTTQGCPFGIFCEGSESPIISNNIVKGVMASQNTPARFSPKVVRSIVGTTQRS